MGTMRKALAVAIVATVGASLGASACTGAPFINASECDPDALFPDPVCLDAGTDAGDAGPDDAGMQDGDNVSAKPECAGRCVPSANGTSAGPWSDLPVFLWRGPKDLMPKCCPGAEGCEPGEVPTMKYRRFEMLVAPPAACEPCECGASEGTCAELPETIEIRAGMCGQSGVSSLPFGGPAGWDGSCSNDGALPAGAMCNGVPCAQSVWASPLPGPTLEACTPKSATPNATVEPAEWLLGGLACQGKARDESCPNTDETCYGDPGPGWMHCVYRDGEHDECPDNYWPTPIKMYLEKPVDDRGCEACDCGQPVGSGCLATVPVYSDNACASLLAQAVVSTFVEGCVNVSPGLALGAKAVENLGYMPGTCAASGGQPKGSASGDVTGAVTFCCGSFFNPK